MPYVQTLIIFLLSFLSVANNLLRQGAVRWAAITDLVKRSRELGVFLKLESTS